MNDSSPACQPAKLQTPEYLHASWAVPVDSGVTLEAVSDPKFWVHVSDRIGVNDTIEVVSPTWDALLRVTVAGDGLIVTRVIYTNAHDAPLVAEKPKKAGIGFVPGKGWRPHGSAQFYASRAEAEAAA